MHTHVLVCRFLSIVLAALRSSLFQEHCLLLFTLGEHLRWCLPPACHLLGILRVHGTSRKEALEQCPSQQTARAGESCLLPTPGEHKVALLRRYTTLLCPCLRRIIHVPSVDERASETISLVPREQTCPLSTLRCISTLGIRYCRHLLDLRSRVQRPLLPACCL